MAYFSDYFGTDGTGFLEDWFESQDTAVSGASIGGGRARLLGTQAPRPQVPPWRFIDGPAGTMLTEVRRYLNELSDRGQNWGNHVEVTFAAPGTPVRVDTGLGGPPQGYKTVRANGDIRVYESAPPDGTDPTPERGIIYLKAAYDDTTLPAGADAVVTLYLY